MKKRSKKQPAVQPMHTHEQQVGGYRIDLEQPAALQAMSTDVLSRVHGLFSRPDNLDPRPYFKIRNQGRQASCQGYGVCAAMAWTYKIATGDPDLDLSEQWAYIESQRVNGISGDRGSSLYGGAQTAMKKGICREQFWPYPSSYQTMPPGGRAAYDKCVEDALRYRAETCQKLRSYDEVMDWLGSGLGGVWIGIRWGDAMNRAVVETYRPGGGGHSVAWLGYNGNRKDNSGNPYIWEANSWGTRWGNNGWSEISPTAVQQMFRDSYTVVMGMSDLFGDGIKPRSINWVEDNPYS